MFSYFHGVLGLVVGREPVSLGLQNSKNCLCHLVAGSKNVVTVKVSRYQVPSSESLCSYSRCFDLFLFLFF